MAVRIIQVPSRSFGYAGLNTKVPTSGTTGRGTYPAPLGIFISCAGDDAENMISRAKADPTYNPPANAPRTGIPHFFIASNGSVYQFVAITNAAWAIESTPVNPTNGIVLAQGTANPNLYGVFITYESSAITGVPIIGSPQGAVVPAAPTPSQIEAIGDVIRLIRATYAALPLITYPATNTEYVCSSVAQLITDVNAYLALPIPPLCNADLCLYDEELPTPEGSLVMVYDPVTLCPTGLVASTELVPPVAPEAISSIMVDTETGGLVAGTPTAYASNALSNPSATESMNVIVFLESKIAGEFDATAGERQISLSAEYDYEIDGAGYSSISGTGQIGSLYGSAYHDNVNEALGGTVGYIKAGINEVARFTLAAGSLLNVRARLTGWGDVAGLTAVNHIIIMGVRVQ